MVIELNNILNISQSEYDEWSICLNNAPSEGIYSFKENYERMLEHISWKKAAKQKTSFRVIGTRYCLQFVRLDKDFKWDNWLFLGAFENEGVQSFDDGHEVYRLKPIERFAEYRDRLIINYKKKQGPKQAKLNINLIATLEVVKILEKPYIEASRPFPGYNNVSLSFPELKRIIDANVDNWRELLTNINCIYVITDTSNGKLYIGSTYGENGVWQRWSCYAGTNGSGNNKELELLKKEAPNYAFEHFRFSILETFFNSDVSEKFIHEREQEWKRRLDTMTPHGYNDN